MKTQLIAVDKSFLVIPIVGMQGIGKTTLGKLIFDNQVVADHFPSRAWPSTSTASSTKYIGDSIPDIIKQLMYCKMRITEGKSYRERQEMMQKLKAFFIDNKPLTVMDHTYDIYYWNDLLEVLVETSNGSIMIWISWKMSIPSNDERRSDPHLLRLRSDEKS